MINNNKIFWALSSAFIVMLLIYVFFIQIGIFYILSAHEWGTKANNLSISLVALEKEYYVLTHSITERSALENGFVAVKNITYAKSTNVNVARAR